MKLMEKRKQTENLKAIIASEALKAWHSSRRRENSAVKNKEIMSRTSGHERQSGRERGKHQKPHLVNVCVHQTQQGGKAKAAELSSCKMEEPISCSSYFAPQGQGFPCRELSVQKTRPLNNSRDNK